jgi:CRP-like cAMP-binding protein
MYEKNVAAGEILIKEGDTGYAASQLYVVKSGKFEVGCGSAAAAGREGGSRWGAGRGQEAAAGDRSRRRRPAAGAQPGAARRGAGSTS